MTRLTAQLLKGLRGFALVSAQQNGRLLLEVVLDGGSALCQGIGQADATYPVLMPRDQSSQSFLKRSL